MIKIELSDFHFSVQILSTKLSHHGSCLCCKLPSLQMQVLFTLVSGEILKDLFENFHKIIFFGSTGICSKVVGLVSTLLILLKL